MCCNHVCLLLIQDVTTRWGSTGAMVGKFLEQQEAVSAVFAQDLKLCNLMPSEKILATLVDVDALFWPLSINLQTPSVVTSMLLRLHFSHSWPTLMIPSPLKMVTVI